MPLEKILCYLPAPSGYASLVNGVCAAQGVVCVPVSPAQAGKTVGALLGLPGRSPGLSAGPAPSQPALVLFGFTRPRMEEFLEALRSAGLPPQVLKAVATPTNLGWTLSALCAELARERDAMDAMAP